MKNWNLARYQARIKNIDWSSMYKSADISASYGIFDKNILEILDEEAPWINIQLRNNHKSWVSKTLKAKIKVRDLSREKARLSQLPADWQVYKSLRNSCTANLKDEKRSYNKMLFQKFESEKYISNLYKLTKNQLGWGVGGPPESLIDNGQRISAPGKMANLQLDCFVEKVAKIVRGLPPTTEDPLKILKVAILRWGQNAELRETFKLREISLIETAQLLK